MRNEWSSSVVHQNSECLSAEVYATLVDACSVDNVIDHRVMGVILFWHIVMLHSHLV